MEERRSEQILLSEIQVLLAEKRTIFAIFRTGMAVMTVPLTVILFLAATSEYHGLFSYLWLAIVIVGGLISVSFGGIVIIYNTQKKLHRINHMIVEIEKLDKRIDEIIV